MNGGIQKWALVAYLILCIWFLAKPSSGQLTARAQSLDKALATHNPATLSPALAAALELSPEAVERFLSGRDAKPSSLVFQKLLNQSNSQSSEEFPAEAVLKSGMTSEAAIAYFDKVEREVSGNISTAKTARVVSASRASQFLGRTALGSRPD